MRIRDDAERRGKLIRTLEDALAMAEELRDGTTVYLIARIVCTRCGVGGADVRPDWRPMT